MRDRTLLRPAGLDMIERRGTEYGSHVRTDLIDLLPLPLGAVLDVGCATGAAAESLRERGATRLHGVELDSVFAKQAEDHFDEVVCGSADGDLPWAPSSFDTIMCYDVLEHLVDPWRTLRRLTALLKPSGRLHVSVPNARHPGTWMPIVLRGTMDYRPAGLRDVTHLRFFGRRDLRDMCVSAGLEVDVLDVVPTASRTMNLALRLSFGRAAEFAAYQWHAIATRRGQGSSADVPDANSPER